MDESEGVNTPEMGTRGLSDGEDGSGSAGALDATWSMCAAREPFVSVISLSQSIFPVEMTIWGWLE